MAEKDDEKYDVLEKIGQGSFGIIRKVRQRQTNKILCRKEISYSRMSDKEKAQLHAELKILESLRHPNIVQYVHREHLKSSHDLHLYMENCGNGDLGGYVKKLKNKGQWADEAFVWGVFAQLVSALYRCHYGEDPPEQGSEGKVSKGRQPYQTKEGYRVILHRDLKPENVFLGDNNSVKLGDFGLSKIIASHDFASTYVGTPFYMSPEICAAERYSHYSDIWSLGCIMYELASRCVPFDAKNHVDLILKIRAGKINPLPSHYSRELESVIGSCLKVNQSSRPDCAQLLNIPNIKLARTRLETQSLREERDSTASRLAQAQKQIQDLAQEIQRLKDQGKKVEMEWHARATLAIDQRVHEQYEAKKAELLRLFDTAVEQRAEEKLGLHLASLPANHGLESGDSQHVRSSTPPPGRTASFTTTNATTHPSEASSMRDDLSNSALETDLTSLSIQEDEPLGDDVSPLAQRTRVPKKSNRKPLGRAKTYATHSLENNPMGSPVDIQMADPSPMPSHVAPPMSIKGLSLSPRKQGQDRYGGGAGLRRNIFQKNGTDAQQLRPSIPGDSIVDISHSTRFADDESEDDDELVTLPDSPSRPSSGLSNDSHKDPFKTLADPPTRPKALPRLSLARQKTMPVSMPQSRAQAPRQNIFQAARAKASPEREKENRPPSANTSASNSRNANTNVKATTTTTTATTTQQQPKEIPHISASSPPKHATAAREPSKVLTPNRKAPPAPPPHSSNVAARANRPRQQQQQKTPAKSAASGNIRGRTLLELSSQNASAAAAGGVTGANAPVLVPTGFADGMASPAKWDPVVEGEGMPSPFLCKVRGVGAVR